jgi:Fe-S-cluster containining protein
LSPDETAADDALVRLTDRALEDATRRAGHWLACRLGCTECCIGPFPITAVDAARLRRGLRLLAASDPRRAAAVRSRAAQAADAMRPALPGDPAAGLLAGGDEAAEDGFLERFAALPCPALDPATGACDLYAARPLSCRSFGPPVRIGGAALPPCRLCFQGASGAEVERCRVEIDDGGLEGALLARIEDEGGSTAETLVAFALLDESGDAAGRSAR